MVDAAAAPLTVALAVSVAAGAVSFASPCVLPLVPGYLAFASGLSGVSGSPTGRGRGTVLTSLQPAISGFTPVL